MLLSLPSTGLGMPVWIILTGTTTALRGYNRLIAKIVPLTAASRSADLIPFMVVRAAALLEHTLPACTMHCFTPLWVAANSLLACAAYRPELQRSMLRRAARNRACCGVCGRAEQDDDDLSVDVDALQANNLNVTRVFLYNLDYGPSTTVAAPVVPLAPPSAQSVVHGPPAAPNQTASPAGGGAAALGPSGSAAPAAPGGGVATGGGGGVANLGPAGSAGQAPAGALPGGGAGQGATVGPPPVIVAASPAPALAPAPAAAAGAVVSGSSAASSAQTAQGATMTAGLIGGGCPHL